MVGDGDGVGTADAADRSVDWRALATGVTDACAVAALESAVLAELGAADVVDAIVTAERLIAHVQGLQAALLADLARPGRAGDVTKLVGVLVGKGGAGRDPVTGEVDPDLVRAEIDSHARSLAAAEVAAALCIPHRTASCRIDRAVELVDELPVTLAALRSGRLDERRARLIADGTRVLAPGVRAAVEGVIVPLAETRVSRRVQELLDRAVIAADPEGALVLEEQARADRGVVHRPGRHGVGHVNATLPAEGAVTVFTLLDLLAQTTDVPGEERGIDARRADALVDICTELLTFGRLDLTGEDLPDDEVSGPGESDGGRPVEAAGEAARANRRPGDEGEDPAGTGAARQTEGAASVPSAGRSWRGLSRHGRRPHLSVTVGLSTLAGLDRLPGQLAGHGAVTAELAVKIAQAAGTMNLIGVHPAAGTAMAVSQTLYRASQQVFDQIATAAGTCRFPSCQQPAWRCDVDHRVAFDHQDPASGGLTRLWDCDPECRRHHLLKTHAQWEVSGSDGDDPCVAWTSPTGHRYVDRPREFTIPGEEIDSWLAEIFAPARRQPPPNPQVPAVPPGVADGPGREEADLRRVDEIRRRVEKLRWEQRRAHSLARLAVLKNPPRATLPPIACQAVPGAGRPGPVAGQAVPGAGRPGPGAGRPGQAVPGAGRPGPGAGQADPASACASRLASVVGERRAGHVEVDHEPGGGVARRRPAPDPDRRARLYIERVARQAAGHPDDDPPPF